MFFLFCFFYKVVELVVGGSVINRAYPVWLTFNILYYMTYQKLLVLVSPASLLASLNEYLIRSQNLKETGHWHKITEAGVKSINKYCVSFIIPIFFCSALVFSVIYIYRFPLKTSQSCYTVNISIPISITQLQQKFRYTAYIKVLHTQKCLVKGTVTWFFFFHNRFALGEYVHVH